MKNTILIIGATSAIAQKCAEEFAKDNFDLILAARDSKKLEIMKKHLYVKYQSKVECLDFDAASLSHTSSLIDKAVEKSPDLNAVLIAHGILPNENEIRKNSELLDDTFQINSISYITILEKIAQYFESNQSKQQRMIGVISSVAGDRGRQSNYLYGTSKGMISIYTQGLRNRLFKSNVSVTTIKPGFVDTPMTQTIPKNFLFSSPEKVAKGIHKAMKKGKHIVYLPWFWKYIMFIIRSIPESIFKKLSL